jgi:F0F1-type ATP synthase delta subunit
LVWLLISQQRVFIFADVLHHLGDLYKIKKKSSFFHIRTSHSLSKKELGSIEQFLKEATNTQIMYEHHIDKRLIAGIRLESDTLLWEYSVNKILNRMRQSLID